MVIEPPSEMAPIRRHPPSSTNRWHTAFVFALCLMAALTVGCKDRYATKAPPPAQSKGDHFGRVEYEPGKPPGRIVQRLHRDMTDAEAARVASSALAARTHNHSEDEPLSSATIELVGWQLGGPYESGKVAIELTYVVVHPKGGQAFWYPADYLSLGLESLELWAMHSLCAVREDGSVDEILHRNSGTADSISRARPQSRVFDGAYCRVEVITTPHVVERTPLKLLVKDDIPLWSQLCLRPVGGAQQQDPLVVLIGVAHSAVELQTPEK